MGFGYLSITEVTDKAGTAVVLYIMNEVRFPHASGFLV